MNHDSASLERLAYALLGISPLLSPGEIVDISWHYDGTRLDVQLRLTVGATTGFSVNPASDGSSVAAVMTTAFDIVQQDLAETEGYWGKAIPSCRPGHAHPAACWEVDGSVALICPADQQVLRVLAVLP